MYTCLPTTQIGAYTFLVEFSFLLKASQETEMSLVGGIWFLRFDVIAKIKDANKRFYMVKGIWVL